MENKVLLVAGPRPFKLNCNFLLLYSTLDKAIQQINPNMVITGMARGVDQMAAEICIDRNIPFIASIPCLDQEYKWGPLNQRDYWNTLLHPLCMPWWIYDGPYYEGCMHERNKWGVDNCTEALFVHDRVTSGGTHSTYLYALKNNKFPISIINPNKLKL